MSRFSGLELRSLSINTFMQFLVRIISSTSTLFTTLFITYFLGLEAVGSFTKVVAFVSLFYIFIDFGFNSIFLKKYFKDFEQNLGNLVVLRLGISIILIPIVASLAFILPHNNLAGTGFSSIEKIGLFIYSFTLIATSLSNTLQALLQKRLSYSLSVFPSFVSSIFLILVVLFSVYSGNFLLLFVAYILSTSINTFFTYIALKQRQAFTLQLHNLPTFAKEMLYASWPLGLMLGFNLLYARADIFLLTFLKPTTDVGIYGISYRFFEITLAIPAFLANSTYPLLLKEADDKKKYTAPFFKYFKLYAVLSLVAMIGIITLPPLIGFLGKSFSLSVAPLQLLSLSLPFFFMTSLLQWHFLIKGKVKMLVPLYVFVLIINVLLNLYLIPQFSYNAAAVTTGVSEGLVFLFMLWYFKRVN
jgi:O-antigen/teichoic acid export membrane protein